MLELGLGVGMWARARQDEGGGHFLLALFYYLMLIKLVRRWL